MAKSPTSLTASLSASVALYDNQQPPKSLQDILLLAQSHYISHRYVPALTLYKLAAEKHHSLPACSSLYALYTSTANVPGLVRSDTKATHVLIHALRIWTARRWSSSRRMLDSPGSRGSMRSKAQDEYDELEEYFVHRRRSSCKGRRQSRASIPVKNPAGHKSHAPKSTTALVPESFESEYRTPMHLRAQENHQSESEDDSSSGEEDEDDEDEDCDDRSECDGCDECEGEDEEHEKEEEARRIGLATTEIEDIIQKLCLMIQKGVLALDEPVVVDAVSTLRKIERGLSQEAEVWKQQQSRSKSLFGSTLSGDDNSNALRPDLLLTQGIDLSFLNFSPEEDAPISQGLPGRSDGERSRHSPRAVATESKTSPVNAAISNLPLAEQERDQDMCRAIRIRVMYTLGWVHQQKGEYHYGAQAYGVCGEIARTGKRPLDSLQQQARVQKQTCKDLEIKAKEQAVLESIRLQEMKEVESRKASLASSSPKPSTKRSSTSCASSIYTTTDTEISSPSSVSSAESTTTPSRASSTISSLSAVWGSSLFRSNSLKSVAATVAGAQESSKKSTPIPKLQRSKSLLLELKSKPLEIPAATETKDSHHHQHHHPRAQHRTKESQQQLRQQSMPILPMAAHRDNAVNCGHCGQTRTLMPLCACKKVRYCNGECRLADLAVHRLTGCHAARIAGGASSLATSDAHTTPTPGVAL
ncbi:hypothetical protein BGX34_010244 [Mortierella sp. NVP85]|nr:hypothetical protein BGX34_010244 [Mortierella sp. NVP85]